MKAAEKIPTAFCHNVMNLWKDQVIYRKEVYFSNEFSQATDFVISKVSFYL